MNPHVTIFSGLLFSTALQLHFRTTLASIAYTHTPTCIRMHMGISNTYRDTHRPTMCAHTPDANTLIAGPIGMLNNPHIDTYT